MSGKGNIWDEYREVYKEDNDEDSFLDVDPALINPDLTVLSDGTDLTVSFGPKKGRHHSTPVKEEQVDWLQERVQNILINFLNFEVPLALPPTTMATGGGLGGGGPKKDEEDKAVEPGAEGNLEDPKALAAALKAIGINQVNTNKQLVSIVSVVNTMAIESKERAKVMDMYTTKLDDYIKHTKQQADDMNAFQKQMKDIHVKLDIREKARLDREEKKDRELKIKSDTFPDIRIPQKGQDVGIETFTSYILRVWSIIRSNDYNVENAGPRNRVIDGILSGLSPQAMSKTTTIRPDDRGDYGYASINDFLADLRKCFCGDSISISAARTFMNRKQHPKECLTAYLSTLFNLWQIAYDERNRSYQVLMEQSVQHLFDDGLKYHLKLVEFPRRKAAGELQYTAQGWQQLKSCMIESEAILKDVNTTSHPLYSSTPQQSRQQSSVEPMDTNAVGGARRKNYQRGQTGGGQRSTTTTTSKPSNNTNNRSGSNYNSNKNPPMSSQQRYKKEAFEAEKKLKEQRKINNQCYRCGKPCQGPPGSGAHYSKNCPLKPKNAAAGMTASLAQEEQESEGNTAAIGSESWFAESEGYTSFDDNLIMSINSQMHNNNFDQWAESWFPEMDVQECVHTTVCSSVATSDIEPRRKKTRGNAVARDQMSKGNGIGPGFNPRKSGL